ncbi:beta-lactamase regulating signal transducer with metallopeptidase domain [Chryseobacterium sp. 7]|uniref:M56 family metallopeptidase n=1 Tax=Chryseobacterium sp. 7 TaxID=2035214 RepID=UPI000EAFE434|nr:M56 family metallopeptidase [Chryseobacterium sp. 7]RLJ32868.1 beta-lactamase regulating signal transducer with metallopeptidase domain [Chryseobacterium sp. 7]
MEAILLYFGKVILCSGVTFLYYQLSLKDKTFHHYNRFYLLAAIVISLLLPLIRVDDFTIEVNNDMYMLLDKIQNFNTEKNIDNGNLYFNIIFSALGLVSFYFLGKLLYGVFKIQQFKNQFQKESFDGINFYRTDLTEAPFSYFKNLFWKNTITLHSDIGKQILKHEMVHIEQKHSFDKIFIEIITSIFWFNPFFHLIKREINLIHEYLADKKAVKQSDTKAFAQMLLASHFSGTQLPVTSPFLSSNLKKRLKMLQKPKTKFGYARRIFALPVVFSIAFAYLVNAKNREIEETNLSITKAVSEIKKDTIRPEKSGQEKIAELKTVSPEDHTKIAGLEKKIKEKEKELKGLDPESDLFSDKIEEISNLASEIGEIASKVEVDQYFNSAEWKNQMKELENMEPLSKKELRKIERAAKKAGKEAAKVAKQFVPPTPPTPPTPPSEPKGYKVYFKNNNTVYYKDLSSKEKEEVRKAMAEAKKAMAEATKARTEGDKARMEGDRARAEGERIRVEGERIRIDGDKIRRDVEKARAEAEKRSASFRDGTFIKVTSGSPGVIVMNADFIKKDGNGNIAMNGVKKFKISGTDDVNYKYYIDGREVSQNDVNSLDTKNISRVNVNTQKNGDLKQGEVRIETKK